MQTDNSYVATTVRISVDHPAEPHCIEMVEAMWFEMEALYGEDESPCLFRPQDVSGDGCAFLVAWIDGSAAGCAAVRRFELAEGEVKRVYVKPLARGRGIARRLMEELEARAQALGYTSLRLETGTLQPHAINLYESLGYAQIPAYGKYMHDPRSVCFRKELRAAGSRT